MAIPPHLAGLHTPTIEPRAPREHVATDAHGDVFGALVAWREARRPCALCTVVGVSGSSPRKLGAKMLVAADGALVGTIGGGAIEHTVVLQAIAAIERGTASEVEHDLTKDLGMCCGGSMRVFIEPQRVAPLLVVYGAGHVADPLCRVAALLGWRVSVVDERPQWATSERFPQADSVRCMPPMATLETFAWDSNTFVVIVTHDHDLDFQLLQALSNKPLAYLGVIGSYRKRERFRQRLRAAGVAEDAVMAFRSPMGIDIGAITAEEIALSIMSECVQVRHGAAGSGQSLVDVDPRAPRVKVDGG